MVKGRLCPNVFVVFCVAAMWVSSVGCSATVVWTQVLGSMGAVGSPTFQTDARMVIWDDKVYIHGGRKDPGGETSDLFMYTPSEGAWVEMQALGTVPPPRRSHAMAAWDGNLYVFAGLLQIDGFPLHSYGDLYAFGTTSLTWTNLTSAAKGVAPQNRFAHAMSVWEGSLYVWGGESKDNFFNDLRAYSIAAQTWTDLSVPAAGMPPASRSHHQMVVWNGTLYVFGGYAGQGDGIQRNDLHAYSISTRTWTDESQPAEGVPPSPRGGHTMAAWNGVLYVFGGSFSFGVYFNDLHAYSTSTRTWTELEASAGSPPSPRKLHAMAVMDGRMFLFGGFAGWGKELLDVHELSVCISQCHANATCSGGVCVCVEGFAGDGSYCADVSECTLGTNNCDANAQCFNTVGSFTCACRTGFTGTGLSCSDNDECTWGTNNCDANAQCSNAVGSFMCACTPGYEGTGVTCSDVNECELAASGNATLSVARGHCHEHALCRNGNGSFTCACLDGYEGDGVICYRLVQITFTSTLQADPDEGTFRGVDAYVQAVADVGGVTRSNVIVTVAAAPEVRRTSGRRLLVPQVKLHTVVMASVNDADAIVKKFKAGLMTSLSASGLTLLALSPITIGLADGALEAGDEALTLSVASSSSSVDKRPGFIAGVILGSIAGLVCIVGAILVVRSSVSSRKRSSDLRSDIESGETIRTELSELGGIPARSLKNGLRLSWAERMGPQTAESLPESQTFDLATCLYFDIVDFSQLCSEKSSSEVSVWLHSIHDVVEKHMIENHVQVVEIRGDCYICATGTVHVHGDEPSSQVGRMLRFACAVQQDLHVIVHTQIRIGVAVGPLTLGYIKASNGAVNVYAYGDTVNLTAGMEQSGRQGLILMTREAAERLTSEHPSVPESEDAATEITPDDLPIQVLQIKGRGSVSVVWYDCETSRIIQNDGQWSPVTRLAI